MNNRFVQQKENMGQKCRLNKEDRRKMGWILTYQSEKKRFKNGTFICFCLCGCVCVRLDEGSSFIFFLCRTIQGTLVCYSEGLLLIRGPYKFL